MILRFALLAFTLYFLWYELVQVKQNRLTYIFDPFNIIDISSATINTIVVVSYGFSLNIMEEKTARLMAAISCVLMWVKLFYWMRLFGNTSFYIRMVVDTIADVMIFLILVFMILFTFGNAMFILNYNRSIDDAAGDNIIIPHFSNSIVNIFLN